MADEKSIRIKVMLGVIPRQYEIHAKAAAAVGVAVVCAAPVRVLSAAFQLLWTCLGMALGVGLGLGLAMHVYEQLQGWQKAHEREQTSQVASKPRKIAVEPSRLKTNLSRVQSNLLEDGSSYVSLMALAGYVVDDKVLRGQVLKGDASFWDVKYRFTDITVDEQMGPRLLKEDWPGLPEPVARELGRIVEHIMRDYISSWYSRLDGGCRFTDEKEKRKLGILRDGQTPAFCDEDAQKESSVRRMVFSTLTHRNIPMLDQTYRVLSAAFGSLATRAEHVNVFSLALLKWTQVLAHTFKHYRDIRRVAEEKNQTDRPSEVQIIREFLLAGKLHKAVTFGLDVPSLLFADAQGTECGTGAPDADALHPPKDATQVLEERLFKTPIIKECELDYNRVVAFRLVRALLPKNDSSSNVVMALVTEIMGACVLQPLMNLWIPSFLNELIVNSLATRVSDQSLGPEDPSDRPANLDEVMDVQAAVGEQIPSSDLEKNTSLISGVSQVSLPSSSPGSAFDRAILESPAPTTPAPRSTASSTDNLADLGDEEIDEKNQKTLGELLLRLSSGAVAELVKYVNLEECRQARLNNQENSVDYDDPACQAAVLRLVMVVEAAVLQGRCSYRPVKQREESNESADNMSEESLSQLLMEMTSDMAAFEKRIEKAANHTQHPQPMIESTSDMDLEPDQNEISTLRTLIATWMHTGQLARAISLIISGMGNVFLPYYRDDAFLSVTTTAQVFKEQMDLFDKVDIMVETMAVLASPRLDIETESLLMPQEMLDGFVASGDNANKGQSRASGVPEDSFAPSASDLMAHHFGNAATPRYLDFHKNAAFALSLRSERERRLCSWESQKVDDDSLRVIHRPGASPSERELHNELHNLARIFYSGTNVLTIRDAARRNDSAEGDPGSPRSLASNAGKTSLVTVENMSKRRPIEIPDEDSSFLLRAQPRPLSAVSVHRDDRNHDLSYKCFIATYEEPIVSNSIHRNQAGRYIRRCFLQYYPIDRTASIMLHNDARTLDRRKGKPLGQEQPNHQQQQQPTPYLSGSFLRERHLCQKWMQRGATAQTFLSSSVMEVADFSATPRAGKALDFVYRMSLFERPMVELAGKRFTIHDAAARGHRSDASALEASDASFSYVLLRIGKEFGRDDGASNSENGIDRSEYRHKVEMGPDGYPMVFLRGLTGTEIKPYRISFVRAALMITSVRQEAQLQCLMDCVKAGSAKSATKARTDAQLRPTMKILEFANDRSPDRLRSSALLRDLKLGVSTIDREQLRRNGLLNPRFPTVIKDLSVLVENSVQAKDVAELSGSNRAVPPSSILYKIRCTATVGLAASDDDANELEPYICDDGTLASEYQEEWIVYRSMKDFQALHKQLKSEVANAESSASTGSRLVGAAAAAFSTASQGRRNRKALVPSLAQASKTGALAVTQKAIVKRGELLQDYIQELLSTGNLLRRSMDLLLWLGASFPFPSEIQGLTMTPVRLVDPLGRTSFVRLISSRGTQAKSNERLSSSRVLSARQKSVEEGLPPIRNPEDTTGMDKSDDGDLIESVLSKVDQVQLADVRNRLVELVKYQFGFENASFLRSRLLSALETASFVAMTKGSEFRYFIYKKHIELLNPQAIAGLLEKTLGILWPDGCWLVPRPVLSVEEEVALRENARRLLHEAFPEQLRAILGKELTADGLDIGLEMLQNRLVVKSLFYMLVDLLWTELFPELRDSLPCASALDIEA